MLAARSMLPLLPFILPRIEGGFAEELAMAGSGLMQADCSWWKEDDPRAALGRDMV
jgi:hypothetical protein